jgi:hypothetical protein
MIGFLAATEIAGNTLDITAQKSMYNPLQRPPARYRQPRIFLRNRQIVTIPTLCLATQDDRMIS